MTYECQRDEPVNAAGVRNGSQLIIKIDGEDDASEAGFSSDYN